MAFAIRRAILARRESKSRRAKRRWGTNGRWQILLTRNLAGPGPALLELSTRLGQLSAAVERARSELTQAEELTAQQRAGVRGLEEAAKAAAEVIATLRSQVAAAKAEHLEQMRAGRPICKMTLSVTRPRSTI